MSATRWLSTYARRAAAAVLDAAACCCVLLSSMMCVWTGGQLPCEWLADARMRACDCVDCVECVCVCTAA